MGTGKQANKTTKTNKVNFKIFLKNDKFYIRAAGKELMIYGVKTKAPYAKYMSTMLQRLYLDDDMKIVLNKMLAEKLLEDTRGKSPDDMTREELIGLCVDMQIQRGTVLAQNRAIQIETYMKGRGYIPPMKKLECIVWYNNLKGNSK